MTQDNDLDWDTTLTLCNNNLDLANELLTMLRDDLPRQKHIFIDAVEKNDIRLMRDIVHQILGSCSYIALPNLKKESEAIQKYLHQSDHEINTSNCAFIKAIDAVIIHPRLKN